MVWLLLLCAEDVGFTARLSVERSPKHEDFTVRSIGELEVRPGVSLEARVVGQPTVRLDAESEATLPWDLWWRPWGELRELYRMESAALPEAVVAKEGGTVAPVRAVERRAGLLVAPTGPEIGIFTIPSEGERTIRIHLDLASSRVMRVEVDDPLEVRIYVLSGVKER